MPKYFYRAKKGPSEIVEDVIEAHNRDEAIDKISHFGYLPVFIEEREDVLQQKAAPKPFLLKLGRIRPAEITIFSRQLAGLIRSGVPILKALSIIAEQSENAAFRDMLLNVAAHVEEGKSLSGSLEAYPALFSAFTLALVRAGEESGMLQEVLERIAGYRRKQEEMLSKIRAAMAYPLLMAFVGIATVVFMFVFVLPKLSTIFAGMGEALPVPTQVVIKISTFLKNKGFYALGGVFAFFLLVSKTSTLQAHRRIRSRLVLNTPFLSRFLRVSELARFCRTLEVMVRSGIPILRAIATSIPILGNEIIKTELTKSAAELEHGASFAASLKKSKVFPPFMTSLIAVGEESGRLEDALNEVAESYEHECDEAIKIMTALLEPAMILVMGLVVGFLVMAMLLPIFQINVMAR